MEIFKAKPGSPLRPKKTIDKEVLKSLDIDDDEICLFVCASGHTLFDRFIEKEGAMAVDLTKGGMLIITQKHQIKFAWIHDFEEVNPIEELKKMVSDAPDELRQRINSIMGESKKESTWDNAPSKSRPRVSLQDVEDSIRRSMSITNETPKTLPSQEASTPTKKLKK